MPVSNGKYGLGRSGSNSFELTLPSLRDPDDPSAGHNVCRVRRPGVQGLIKVGVLDSFDSLTSIVKKEHLDRVDPKSGALPKEAVQDLANDAEGIMRALDLVDKIVAHCLVEPKVQLPPEDDDERDDEVIYTDEVDLEDKMFIMQYAVGGSSDLDQFRKGTAELVGGLADGEVLQLPSI